MQQVIVYAFTTGLLFFLSLITIASPRKVNIKANLWLGLFLFAFACVILDRIFFDIRVYDAYPELMGLLEITRFAMAPALFFSVLFFTIPDRKFKTLDYLHFVPFFLFAIYIITVLLRINEGPLFRWYFALPDIVRRSVATMMFSSIKIQVIVYWILSYWQLVRHQRNIRLFASTLQPVALKWLQYFLLGLVVALFLSLNEVLIVVPAIIPITHFGYLILTFYMGYYLILQQEIYPYQQKDVVELRDIFETDQQTTKAKRMTSEELASSQQKLLYVMETEKVYLNPDLGLPQLAEQLNMSTHDLSFVINEGFQENFFQFINRYRVEEAKILLKSPQHKHLSILGIAFESGFRSKTTFNTTFKKVTGLSPSQFITIDSPLDTKLT